MSEMSDKLNRYLVAIEKGNKKIKKESDARLFLEALCSQPNHVGCIEGLLSSPNTMTCLENSFRVDTTTDFIEGPATAFVKYLKDSRIENLSNGHFLRKILLSIVKPPQFWNALVRSVRGHELSQASQHAFSWLILNLLKLSNATTEFVSLAKDLIQNQSFAASPSHDIRNFCGKTQNTLQLMFANKGHVKKKHDNDFRNFRHISILPTPDEIASAKTRFCRRADEIYEVEQDRRAAVHIDSQFRLLREDFLTELRQDLQVALGNKRPGRPVYRVEGLEWVGMKRSYIRSNRQCCVSFRCHKGLLQLSDLPKDQRKTAVRNDPGLPKHRAFGCLIYKKDILAFGSINRATSDLLSDTPILDIEVVGSNALKKLLNRSAITWESDSLAFVLLDTPVSAYEPILSSLQQKRDSPLTETLLSPTPYHTNYEVRESVTQFITQLKAKPEMKISNETGEPEKVALDEYQMNALTSSLENTVSLIQGAPGKRRHFLLQIKPKVHFAKFKHRHR
jgi:hypothetical protein